MQVSILGVKIHKITFKEAVKKIDGLILSKRAHQVVTVNPEFIVEAQTNPKFRKILNNASLAVPDGVGILWAAKYKGVNLPHTITGNDLLWELSDLASKKEYSIYLLGAGTGIAKKAAKKLKKKFPNLKIIGADEGINKNLWASQNIVKMIQRVAKTSPDILFVAFGAPKQEIFIAESLKNLNCRVAIGVGGAFDYASGKIKRAPKWARNLGLEWFYRLIIQPSRIRRIYNAIIRFPILILLNKK